MLVIVCLLVCFVIAARITPGAPRRLSPDQDGGLMLRGDLRCPRPSGPEWGTEFQGESQVLCEFGDCL